MKKYVSYGSNMNINDMKFRCPGAKMLGTSKLENHSLEFLGGDNEWSYATIKAKIGENVPIVIWEIDDMEEAGLDYYEGFPHLYSKENVSFEIDGQVKQGLIYVMLPNFQDYCLPSSRYCNCLIEAYKQHDFDLNYLYQKFDVAKELGRQQIENALESMEL